MKRLVIGIALIVIAAAAWSSQMQATASQQTKTNSDVKMVVVLMRHGVRSPTHPGELNPYASQAWPTWNVPGGYLTSRGARLVRQFGTNYRRVYGGMPLFAASRCPAKNSLYIWADVDERTRASGTAIASGLAPGCAIAVNHAPSDPDRLFDPISSMGKIDVAQSRAAVSGAIGDDPNAFVRAYHAEFSLLDDILGCAAARCKQVSKVPSTITSTGDGGLAEISGGLDVASDVVESFLLEYIDGHSSVGWGKVDRNRLVQLLTIHTIGSQIEHANYYTARVHGSNITAHILQTLEQGASNKKVAGTAVPLASTFVVLVGHDTQLSEIGGLLHLSWLVDGYQMNDTPPGSALVFELHSNGASMPFIRMFFTAQSLDGMRTLRGTNAARVPVYIPGCPSLDCPIQAFAHVVNAAVDPAFVAPW